MANRPDPLLADKNFAPKRNQGAQRPQGIAL